MHTPEQPSPMAHRKRTSRPQRTVTIDERFGLCSVRVPTWAPFRLQICFNGHNWLARRLQAAGVGCRLADNAFLAIDDFDQAQALARDSDVRVLHRRLEHGARRFCPVLRHVPSGYHGSIMQAELSHRRPVPSPGPLPAALRRHDPHRRPQHQGRPGGHLPLSASSRRPGPARPATTSRRGSTAPASVTTWGPLRSAKSWRT